MEKIDMALKYKELFVLNKISSQQFFHRVESFYVLLNKSIEGAEAWHTDSWAKKFREELYPMEIFLRNTDNFTEVQMSEENESYDACVFRENSEFRVEITTGDGDKEIEFWQSRYRDRDLSPGTPITGVTKQGFKNAVEKDQSYFGHAVSRSDSIKEIVENVEIAIKKKQEKGVYNGCILLVSINKDFTRRHLEAACKEIIEKCSIDREQFSEVNLIGLQTKKTIKFSKKSFV